MAKKYFVGGLLFVLVIIMGVVGFALYLNYVGESYYESVKEGQKTVVHTAPAQIRNDLIISDKFYNVALKHGDEATGNYNLRYFNIQMMSEYFKYVMPNDEVRIILAYEDYFALGWKHNINGFFETEGKVIEITPSVNIPAGNRNLKIMLVGPAPYDDLYQNCKITFKKKISSLAVPKSALYIDKENKDEDINFVYVVDENNIIHKRDVKVGIAVNPEGTEIDMVVVLQGLEPNDIIVAEHYENLKPEIEIVQKNSIGGEKKDE